MWRHIVANIEKCKEERTCIMKKKLMTTLAFVICVALSVPMIAKAEDVKISDVDYLVSYNGASDMFLCNKKSAGTGVGTEVYLTYTVEKVESCEATVHGVGATGQPATVYPYSTGTMDFSSNKKEFLLQEGYTYFYKFAVTEEGFTYNIIKAKGDEAVYLELPSKTGRMEDTLEYFGLWLGGGKVSAKLKNVRCYDKAGNDLGVQFSRSHGVSIAKDMTYVKNANLNHAYQVTIDKQHSVALCSGKPTTSNTVYMEYKVKSSNSNIIQTGAMITQAPTTIYPYSGGNGFMLLEGMSEAGNGSLLMEGAEYIICMEKKADGFSVAVQRTYKGEKVIFSFPTSAGAYGQQFPYFGLWFGTGTEHLVDCVLTDFKCYDAENNNLGVQCSRPFESEHSGEIEDYAGCEAVYYCEQDDSLIALYEDRTMKFTKDGVTNEGSYFVSDAKDKTITLSYGNGKEVFDYLYQEFTAEDGRTYKRLGSYKVSFVTGTKENIETQTVSAKTGYVAKQPETPKMENNTFGGWVTQNGEEFDFNQIITQSITLYAKWVDDEGRVTVALPETSAGLKAGSENKIWIPIVAGVIVAGSVAGGVFLILRGGKKHGREE